MINAPIADPMSIIFRGRQIINLRDVLGKYECRRAAVDGDASGLQSDTQCRI